MRKKPSQILWDRYQAERRVKAAAEELERARAAFVAADRAAAELVAQEGAIEGYGCVFRLDGDALVVEPVTSCYALDGRAAVGRRDDMSDLALVGAAEAMELPDDAA